MTRHHRLLVGALVVAACGAMSACPKPLPHPDEPDVVVVTPRTEDAGVDVTEPPPAVDGGDIYDRACSTLALIPGCQREAFPEAGTCAGALRRADGHLTELRPACVAVQTSVAGVRTCSKAWKTACSP